MRFLRLSSLLLLAACATPKIQQQQNLPCKNPVSFSWDTTLYYKASISVMGNNLSGLIIFNKQNDSTFRLIMTTDVGPKLIDMELTPKGYTKNFVIEQLDRKALLHMFWEDFGTTLGLFARNKAGFYNSELDACCFPISSRFTTCYTSPGSQTFPEKAYFFERDKKKTTISYFYKFGQQPDSISIEHLSFNMSYILRKFD